ncbi:MAG: CcoQ/FixQ family Cbb3-type cytochrome c oxidase assembly chaperone [Flavobacteriales bacterium]|jgi:cytochrome c oxidase cbb3-type subunit 3
MKFINYLESIAGISIYPLLSLILFAVIFAAVIIKTYSTDNQTIDEHKNLPIQ